MSSRLPKPECAWEVAKLIAVVMQTDLSAPGPGLHDVPQACG